MSTTSANASTARPARPRPTLTIGVTGHRTFEQVDHPQIDRAIATTLRLLAEAVAWTATEGAPPPRLRVVSTLAEGADRLVAKRAVADGHDLQCPLPFGRHVYTGDFLSSSSIDEFHRLLQSASAVTELDGSTESEMARGAAYLACGRMMLSHVDLMIAIWDGEASRGSGGTQHMIREALERRIPVIWIEAVAPHGVRLMRSESSLRSEQRAPEINFNDKRSTNNLTDLVANILTPGWLKRVEGSPGARQHRYFDESLSVSSGVRAYDGLWTLFFRLFAGPPEAEQALNVPREVAQTLAPYGPFVEAAEIVAQRYANRYRSSIVFNYTLGAVAVFLALISTGVLYYLHDGSGIQRPSLLAVKYALVLAELSVLLIVYCNYRLARTRAWQERLLDYRVLAEVLRHQLALAALGLVVRLPRPPAHREERSTQAWMSTFARYAVRDVGLPPLDYNKPEVKEALRYYLRDVWLHGQIAYHSGTAARYHRFHRRLEWLNVFLFISSIVACVGSGMVPFPFWVLGTAGFPAIIGSFHAIVSLAEMPRLARRSSAMSRSLQTFADQLNVAGNTLDDWRDVASGAAASMLDEALDWGVEYGTASPALP